MRLTLLLKRLPRFKTGLFISLLIIFFFIVLYFLYGLFLVRNIVVISKNKKKDIQGLSVYQNKNILLLSTEVAEKEILKKNAQLQKVSIKKVLPQKLLVEVAQYLPIAFLKVSNGFFVLSEDGRILFKKKEEDKGLPVMNYYQTFDAASYDVGQFLNLKDITTTLIFLKKLNELGMKVDDVAIDGPHMILCKVQNKELIFSAEKSKEKTLLELETIVRQFTVEGKEFKSLDLRFDKPIVKF
ncbi:hypothetical protein HYW87_03540 [Candidatus Roizmanbacteria bacterium]|nr:hypothetical protein [Candidatus Roizmanbacteria bacterium]